MSTAHSLLSIELKCLTYHVIGHIANSMRSRRRSTLDQRSLMLSYQLTATATTRTRQPDVNGSSMAGALSSERRRHAANSKSTLVRRSHGSPNYYNLVLTTPAADPIVIRQFVDAGLPPDSLRYSHRPLYHQPIFRANARPCPNAEALAAAAIQLPVHPGLTETAVGWIARCVCTIATNQLEPI
jgi:hypothetical protein